MSNETELEKFIVFTIAQYRLALATHQVLRVTNYSSKLSAKVGTTRLLHLDRCTIQILELQQLLNSDLSESLTASPFLIVTHNGQGQLYGIPVQAPPDLLELPSGLMRSLPQTSHPSNIFKVANHAAVVSQNEVTTTIFRLDVERAAQLDTDSPLLLSSSRSESR